MGLFGKSFESKNTSRVGGGAKRVTTNYTDRSSESKTYNNGKLVSITHSKDGKTHSHKVARNIFGPYAGKKI